jgi:hypothetical protein
MFWAIFAICVAVLFTGWWLLRRPKERAVFKWKDAQIDAQVGVVVIVFSLCGAVFAYTQNTSSLEKDIARITGEKNDTKDKLAKSEKDFASTKQSLSDEQKKENELTKENDDLTRKLAASEAQARDVQGQAKAVLRTINRFGLSKQQQAEFDTLENGIGEVNQHLTWLRIGIAYWPRIEGRNAVATFEIHRQAFENDQTSARGAGLFDFPSTEYKIRLISGNQEGIPVKLENEIIGSICEAAKSAALNEIRLDEAISKILTLTGYDLNRQVIAQLTEFTYVAMRLQLMAAEALVLVRGYADGQMAPWSNPVNNSLTSIRVHENMTPDAPEDNGGLNFRKELTSVAIGQEANGHTSYTNVDLPNLRAQEVWKKLTDVVHCPQPTPNTSVGTLAVETLQGRVYPEHKKEDRRVRVHLLVFLKSS